MLSVHKKYIKECFKLAQKSGLDVLPNPKTGCIIVKDGKIISKGYHEIYGGYHAERNALLNLSTEEAEGADLYVNLEPCSHFGKTPPCTDIIIEKKIKRVFFSNFDTNPKVNGANILKEAGIETTGGILEKEGRELNKVFFKNIEKKLPYVMLKIATTLDSKIATQNGKSKWITSDKSRLKVMELRSSYQAIMTGSNTVLTDNPLLTSRIKNGRNPIRIIMDKKGVLKGNENVFNDDGTKVIVINNSNGKYPSFVEKVPFENFDTLMKILFEKGICSIMAESGQGLNSALIQAGIVDEINHFVAPKIFGNGLDFVSNLGIFEIKDCKKAKDIKIKRCGEDILLNYKLE